MAQVGAVCSASLEVIHEGRSAVSVTVFCETTACLGFAENVWEALQELTSAYKV